MSPMHPDLVHLGNLEIPREACLGFRFLTLNYLLVIRDPYIFVNITVTLYLLPEIFKNLGALFRMRDELEYHIHISYVRNALKCMKIQVFQFS